MVYHLLAGPEGMAIDAMTGAVTWTPADGALDQSPVTIQAFDSRGAVALQRFILSVEGGNRAPEFVGVPTQVDGVEGTAMEFRIAATDADADILAMWADNLPPASDQPVRTRSAE